VIAAQHPDCGDLLDRPDDLWAAEQKLYRAVELQASLKRRRGLALRWYRGEHRPKPSSWTVDELRAAWEAGELQRRIAHRRSLRRQFNPGPHYLGEKLSTIRLWLPGDLDSADTVTGTLELIGAEPVLTLPVLGCDPGPAVPELEWTEDGRLLADGQEIALSPVEQKCLAGSVELERESEERKQALERKLAELDAAGEILREGGFW
jgi:hypothetical protein